MHVYRRFIEVHTVPKLSHLIPDEDFLALATIQINARHLSIILYHVNLSFPEMTDLTDSFSQSDRSFLRNL